MVNTFEVIEIFVKNQTELDQISAIAFNDYNCLGIEEYDISISDCKKILEDKSKLFSVSPSSDELYLIDSKIGISQRRKQVKIYFSNSVNGSDDCKKFFELLKLNFSKTPKLFVKENENWNEKWKKYFEPIEISEDLFVVPIWLKHLYPNSSIFIEPGMGFGTGSHETTYLCLKFIEKISQKTNINKVLDFGCGSGILGIAAAKIFDTDVDFLDIDSDALENCSQNIKYNSLESGQDKIYRVILRKMYEIKPYDLVFANILKGTLLNEMVTISKSVAPGGFLVLSGLLTDQVNDVVENYTNKINSLFKVDILYKGEWAAILLGKEN